jgi:HlyD family secretion protein
MKWLMGLFAAVLAATSLAWWSQGLPVDRVKNTRGDAMETEGTITASHGKGTAIQGIGYIEPASEVRRLVFKTDGVIERCLVSAGDRVTKGTELMALADAEARGAVAVAEQELAVRAAEREQVMAGTHQHLIDAAEHRLAMLVERARHAEAHLARIERLNPTRAATKAEYDQARTEAVQAQKSRRQAAAELDDLREFVRPVDRAVCDAQVGLAQARLAAARSRLADTILLAPFDGSVLEILRREGEAARGADLEPVILFADDSQLRVRSEIDERYVDRLRVGQAASISGRGLGGRRHIGQIVLVKRVMGGKTVFSRRSSERKDLDVLQVLIDLPDGVHAPIGLQVDVAIELQVRSG